MYLGFFSVKSISYFSPLTPNNKFLPSILIIYPFVSLNIFLIFSFVFSILFFLSPNLPASSANVMEFFLPLLSSFQSPTYSHLNIHKLPHRSFLLILHSQQYLFQSCDFDCIPTFCHINFYCTHLLYFLYIWLNVIFLIKLFLQIFY